MTIRFHCNECQSRVKVPDGTQGKKVKCPRCGNVQRVPEGDDVPRPVQAKPNPDSQPEPTPGEAANASVSAEQETVDQSAAELSDSDQSEDSADPLAALAAAAGTGDDESESSAAWDEPDAEQTQPEPEPESEPEPDEDEQDEEDDDEEQADAQAAAQTRDEHEDQEEQEEQAAGDDDDENHDAHQPVAQQRQPAKPQPQHAPESKAEPTAEKPQSLGTPKTMRARPTPQPAGTPKAIPLSSRVQSSYHPPAQVKPQSEQVGGSDDPRSQDVVKQAPQPRLAEAKAIRPPGYPAMQAVSWTLRILAVLTLAMSVGMSVPLFQDGSTMLGLAAVIVGLVLAAIQLALGEAVSALRDIARNSFHLTR